MIEEEPVVGLIAATTAWIELIYALLLLLLMSSAITIGSRLVGASDELEESVGRERRERTQGWASARRRERRQMVKKEEIREGKGGGGFLWGPQSSFCPFFFFIKNPHFSLKLKNWSFQWPRIRFKFCFVSTEANLIGVICILT